MIYEYAVDPALMAQREVNAKLRDTMGPDNGRLISNFPEGWYEEAYCLIKSKNKKTQVAKKILMNNLVEMQREGAIFDRIIATSWNRKFGWLHNAMKENTLNPFQSILADVEEAEPEKKILPGPYVSSAYDDWKIKKSVDVYRKAKHMGGAIKPLLELSRQIVFVDPHFNPSLPRFRNPLKEFLEIISNRKTKIPIIRVIYHVSDRLEGDFFKEHADGRLPEIIPKDITLLFQKSPEGPMHDRFVLTDIGAVQIGIGLDEYREGSETAEEAKITNIGLAKTDFNRYTSQPIFHQIQGLR